MAGCRSRSSRSNDVPGPARRRGRRTAHVRGVYAPGPRARAAHRGARRRAAPGSRGRGGGGEGGGKKGEEEEEGEEAPPTLTEARLTDPRSTDRSCPENRVVHIRRSHNRPTQVGNRRRERLTRARDDRARRCSS